MVAMKVARGTSVNTSFGGVILSLPNIPFSPVDMPIFIMFISE